MGREDRQILSHQAPVLEPRDTHLALRSLFPHPWVASTQENPEAYWGGVFRSSWTLRVGSSCVLPRPIHPL